MGQPAPARLTPAAAGAPAEPVPVAILARTSTLALQDPVASLHRQIRSCQAWLPAGWYIAAYYWDVESGGLDLEARSQGHAWEPFAAAGIPRDGGMADLLTEARAPVPCFAAVVCEDIERSGRDTFNALKLEKELTREGIPLFATDEPASIEGVNATTVLVRRVKQGVAEWFRLQLKEKAWKGLEEHSLAGWNIGSAPYGYTADRIPHPVPAKASQGRTKTRLALDPVRAPVVEQIYTWRIVSRLSIRAITLRLNADPAAYPTPDGKPGWAQNSVAKILANPKYTGHMVYGRSRTTPSSRTRRPAPPDQWIWTPGPVHPAIITRTDWDKAQKTGAERGNTRDTETPTTRTGRRYILRSRIRHHDGDCKRRMCGTWRSSASGAVYIYYRCPHDPRNPRHAATHPDHGTVTLPETAIMNALSQFFTQYVFGHDRAELLAAQLPATTAEHEQARARNKTRLDTELTRIDTAERALISELETPADPGDPAAKAYRARIRARFSDLYTERTRIETQLAELQATAPPDNDTDLLNQLPRATLAFTRAPARIQETLLTAFNIQILYRHDQDQVTIWATITSDTPRTITALLSDPRTDHDTQPPTPHHDTTYHSAPTPIGDMAAHNGNKAAQPGLQEPDELGLSGFGVPDDQSLVGAQLRVDELIQRDRAVNQVSLGQRRPVLEVLEIYARLRDQRHGDPVGLLAGGLFPNRISVFRLDSITARTRWHCARSPLRRRAGCEPAAPSCRIKLLYCRDIDCKISIVSLRYSSIPSSLLSSDWSQDPLATPPRLNGTSPENGRWAGLARLGNRGRPAHQVLRQNVPPA